MPLAPLGDSPRRPSETTLLGFPSDVPAPSLGFPPVVGEPHEFEAAWAFSLLSACWLGELNDACLFWVYGQSINPWRRYSALQSFSKRLRVSGISSSCSISLSLRCSLSSPFQHPYRMLSDSSLGRTLPFFVPGLSDGAFDFLRTPLPASTSSLVPGLCQDFHLIEYAHAVRTARGQGWPRAPGQRCQDQNLIQEKHQVQWPH
jgi:hypothetical protein